MEPPARARRTRWSAPLRSRPNPNATPTPDPTPKLGSHPHPHPCPPFPSTRPQRHTHPKAYPESSGAPQEPGLVPLAAAALFEQIAAAPRGVCYSLQLSALEIVSCSPLFTLIFPLSRPPLSLRTLLSLTPSLSHSFSLTPLLTLSLLHSPHSISSLLSPLLALLPLLSPLPTSLSLPTPFLYHMPSLASHPFSQLCTPPSPPFFLSLSWKRSALTCFTGDVAWCSDPPQPMAFIFMDSERCFNAPFPS